MYLKKDHESGVTTVECLERSNDPRFGRRLCP